MASPIFDDNIPATDEDKKIISEFCYLLEKSKQLFSGLRDLPQYGHKAWQGYFGRTFDVFTKLWKFQQQHRDILDNSYKLKRWQIGEIASKIGQLYYHYYLRTSETFYLTEAYSFYSAIRNRAYFNCSNKDNKADLMVKKLRYYARFIVVCLLLRKMKVVGDLSEELSMHLEEYSATYDPDDRVEWQLVLGEIHSFLEAESAIKVLDDEDGVEMSIFHRVKPQTIPALESSIVSSISLKEVLIIGSCHEQVKFSELTLDMYRMLQAVERESLSDSISPMSLRDDHSTLTRPQDRLETMENGETAVKRDNPHKYLLYKPTFCQIYVFLSAAYKDLPRNGALLLYVSGDGCPGSERPQDDGAYDSGGISTNVKRENNDQKLSTKRPQHIKNTSCIHPGDLYPFLRKPMFFILDSSNSGVFKTTPNLFGQPFVCLMSPTTMVGPLKERVIHGNVFTYFLHSPLMAFLHLCDKDSVPMSQWSHCEEIVSNFMSEANKLICRSKELHLDLQIFYGDQLLRQIILRHIFCYCSLRRHELYNKDESYWPSSHPALPENILMSQNLERILFQLATDLDVRSSFAEISSDDG